MSDETFTDDNFTPDEAAIIRRLREAESPRLAPRVYDAIHAVVLAEVDHMGAVPRRTSQPRIMRLAVMVASAAAAALILFVIFVNLRGGGAPIVGPTETITQVVQQSSFTPTPSPSVESETVSITPSVIVSPTVDVSTPTVVTVAPTVATIAPTFTSIPVTDTPTPTLSPTLETVVVLAGTIQQIEAETLTVNGVLVHVPPGYPMLELVEVGDVVRVQGVQDESGGIIASIINNVTDSEVEDATVTMDGPLESLDDDREGEEVGGVVNGIEVLFDADEPLLETIVIGDFLSIQGNFELRDGLFVLVVVEVRVVENVPSGTPSNCWYHDDAMGMGGHWHCDGMGMGGMGGMGMEN